VAAAPEGELDRLDRCVGIWASWSGPTSDETRRVVFVHGAADTGRSFGPVIERLGDVRVLTYDRRGWGRSVAAVPPATAIGDHVEDLLGLLAGRPATVVAHSFGCCIALLASIRRPETIRSLGLWEPPLPWEEWWPQPARDVVARIVADPDPEAVGERLVRTVLGDRAWEQLGEATRRRRRAEGVAFVEEAREQLTRQFELEEVSVPCVIGRGAQTWPHMLDATRRVATVLRADLVEVAAADHFGHVSHPDEFATFARRAINLA
jgi:pimeloyl-ACP methyl ester carboxylesterase